MFVSIYLYYIGTVVCFQVLRRGHRGILYIMMKYGNDWGWGMMGGGYEGLCFITWLVVIVDLVLLGAWLWKQIKK